MNEHADVIATTRARAVIELAGEVASRLGHSRVGTAHLLLAIIEEGEGVGVTILEGMGAHIKRRRRYLERHATEDFPAEEGGESRHSASFRRAVDLAIAASRSIGHPYVGTEHLLLGLAGEEHGIAGALLRRMRLDAEVLREHVLVLIGR